MAPADCFSILLVPVAWASLSLARRISAKPTPGVLAAGTACVILASTIGALSMAFLLLFAPASLRRGFALEGHRIAHPSRSELDS